MPIRPENRARSPRNWPDISGQVRERAGHRCEWSGCGAAQYAVGHWVQRDGAWCWSPYGGSGPADAAGRGLRWPDMQPWSFAEARQFAAELDWACGEEGRKPTVIVLTVAHLDHTPENCALDNLRAWCQRHHLAYDAEHHAASRAKNRDLATGQLQLLEA